MIDLKQEKIIAEHSHKIVETFLWWGQVGALTIAAMTWADKWTFHKLTSQVSRQTE